MKTQFIVHLSDPRLPDSLGSKARNLRILKEKRFRVPDTYVCTWDAYHEYLHEGPQVLNRIRAELARALPPGRSYAVRSSANLEDSQECSFAGQFKTFLNVDGIDGILQAISSIYDTTLSTEVHAYLNKLQRNWPDLKMAVIIQEMVPPVISGVAFSKNPVTGLDEVVVEAVHGCGTALVQNGRTPYRLVHKRGKWIHRGAGEEIPLELVQQIVDGTRAIAHALEQDVDLEWVYDGRKLYWLQVREITSLRQVKIYSNKMAKELSPGMIKPLVWSVTAPIPSHSWLQLITEVIGKNELQAADLVKAFQYRAYHNVGIFGEIFADLGLPREAIEIVMGVVPHGPQRPKFRPGLKTVRHIPRMLRFIFDKWNFGRKAEREYPQQETDAHAFPLSLSSEPEAGILLAEIDRIIDLSQHTSYNTVCSILLMQIYTGLLKAYLAKLGVDFQQFDLTANLEELQLYDPGAKLAELHRQLNEAALELRQAAQIGDYAAFQALAPADPLRQGVEEFLNRFGHLSDSGTNFATVPWRETPGLVLQFAANYQRPEDPPPARIRLQDLPTRGPGRWVLRRCYSRARQFRLLREKYSSLFTYTLMLLRVYYLALGDLLVRAGLLTGREDIYYLYDVEVRAYFAGQADGQDFPSLVEGRKEEMARSSDSILPEVIYGDSLPPVILSARQKLAGTPTSRGYCTGTVKVVCGPSDVEKVQPGDVLVIPYSDVSWSPLFARAGGIISESGGILSHSSIIAREYQIPSVVSVANVTRLLHDGDLITVDGYTGEIRVYPPTGGG